MLRLNAVSCLEVQLDDTVAAVQSRDRIVVNTFDFEVSLFQCVVAVVDVESYGITFANRVVSL